MNTPIRDFIEDYAKKDSIRLHMPGHKGVGGVTEKYDITEIDGADNLYSPDGIIAESEDNASDVFGCHTYYSAEGSSLAIRAILFLLRLYASSRNVPPVVWASRNVHKTFLMSSALLNIKTEWIVSKTQLSYMSCDIDISALDTALKETQEKPVAVYVTSPDYLGNTVDIASVSEVCHKNGVLLVVDNAHGAYLKFLSESLHPIDLGADICCDSAHKTLPALTGAAYLHISLKAPSIFSKMVKYAFSMFGSTSPSYLILRSLDLLNPYLKDKYRFELSDILHCISSIRMNMESNGYRLIGDEPLKITVETKSYGYTGYHFADIMRQNNIMCEFYDPDFAVFMLSTSLTEDELSYFEKVVLRIPRKPRIDSIMPMFRLPKRVISATQAMILPCEEIDTELCAGRISAAPSVCCPPAVPIVMSGEYIDRHIANCFSYYGIKRCIVLK